MGTFRMFCRSSDMSFLKTGVGGSEAGDAVKSAIIDMYV